MNTNSGGDRGGQVVAPTPTNKNLEKRLYRKFSIFLFFLYVLPLLFLLPYSSFFFF
jgi:hypothetical protein